MDIQENQENPQLAWVVTSGSESTKGVHETVTEDSSDFILFEKPQRQSTTVHFNGGLRSFATLRFLHGWSRETTLEKSRLQHQGNELGTKDQSAEKTTYVDSKLSTRNLVSSDIL